MARRKQRSQTNDDRAYLIGTILGISVGAIFCLSGFMIVILGFTGNIEWIVQAKNFSSKLTNAGPGVLFAFLGTVILWRYKPRTFTHQMRDEILGRSWDIGIRELKEMPFKAEHIKEMMRMFDSPRIQDNTSTETESSSSGGSQASPDATRPSQPDKGDSGRADPKS